MSLSDSSCKRRFKTNTRSKGNDIVVSDAKTCVNKGCDYIKADSKGTIEEAPKCSEDDVKTRSHFVCETNPTDTCLLVGWYLV